MTLPVGMKESTQFVPALFTPSTKAEIGDKDENIHPDECMFTFYLFFFRRLVYSFRGLINFFVLIGITVKNILPSPEWAEPLKSYALSLYTTAATHSLSQGLILADTKFEFGLLPPPTSSPPNTKPTLILVDECLTPDSSRFWPRDQWGEGNKMVGFDKQFLREWLKNGGGGFGKKGGGIEEDGVEIPVEIIEATWGKYCEAFEMLTGKAFVV